MIDGRLGVSDDESFETALHSLLAAAHDAGLRVDRSFVSRNGPERPDWEILITELEKP